MAITTQNPSDQQQRITGTRNLTTLNASVIGTATAVVLPGSRFIADKAYQVVSMSLNMGTTGTGGQTDVVCNIDGSAVANFTATVANTAADGTTVSVGPAAETLVNPGQILDLEATAVGTANANLTAQLFLAEVLG